MSRVSSMLSLHEPWCHSTATNICTTTTDARFGLNDPLSCSTFQAHDFVPSSSVETANFSNPSIKVIHCLNYGAYVDAIPPPHHKPSQCDRILYAEDHTHFILAEMKVSAKKGVKVRQLQNTILHLLSIQELVAFMRDFEIKRCCFFRKVPQPPVPTLTAVASFNRPARLSPKKGIPVKNPQLTDSFLRVGFELWSFNTGDVCEIS